MDKIINAVGYPYWDKALTYTNFSAASKGSSDDETNYFYFPFVKENEDGTEGNVVDATLIFRISPEDTSFKWVCDWQYRDTTNTGLTKTEIPSLMMGLDYEVFGLRNYEMLDTTIFDGRARTVHVSHLSNSTTNYSGRNSILDHTIEICITYQVPQYGWLYGCAPGEPCNPYIEITECETISFENEGGGWNNSGGGGNPPPGEGGGGGNWVPPPCTGAACNPGWVPEPEINNYPNTPCSVVDSLLKTTAFPQHLNMLRDSTPIHHEKGISFTLPDVTANTHTYYTGEGILGVNVDPNGPVDGIMHNHYDTSARHLIFSAEDIVGLGFNLIHNEIRNTKTFTYTLVTDSTSYILMIEDSAKFRNFINIWFDTDKHIRDFATIFYDTYHVADQGISSIEREKRFFQAMNAFPSGGCGLKLFRGNANMTIFTPSNLMLMGRLDLLPVNKHLKIIS